MLLYCLKHFLTLNLTFTKNKPKNVYFRKHGKFSKPRRSFSKISGRPVTQYKFKTELKMLKLNNKKQLY